MRSSLRLAVTSFPNLAAHYRQRLAARGEEAAPGLFERCISTPTVLVAIPRPSFYWHLLLETAIPLAGVLRQRLNEQQGSQGAASGKAGETVAGNDKGGCGAFESCDRGDALGSALPPVRNRHDAFSGEEEREEKEEDDGEERTPNAPPAPSFLVLIDSDWTRSEVPEWSVALLKPLGGRIPITSSLTALPNDTCFTDLTVGYTPYLHSAPLFRKAVRFLMSRHGVRVGDAWSSSRLLRRMTGGGGGGRGGGGGGGEEWEGEAIAMKALFVQRAQAGFDKEMMERGGDRRGGGRKPTRVITNLDTIVDHLKRLRIPQIHGPGIGGAPGGASGVWAPLAGAEVVSFDGMRHADQVSLTERLSNYLYKRICGKCSFAHTVV